MPFDQKGLTVLSESATFTLWHYRTQDLRADVQAPDYFPAPSGGPGPGDMVIVQAADAMAMLPVRADRAVGEGVLVDSAAALRRLRANVAQGFTVTQAAPAVLRALELGPVAQAVALGPLAVRATVTGPVARVGFSLRDATGRAVGTAVVAAVSGGAATASLAVAAAGRGLRVRADAVDEPGVSALSSPFTAGDGVAPAPAADSLTTEGGARLLLEQGGLLLA